MTRTWLISGACKNAVNISAIERFLFSIEEARYEVKLTRLSLSYKMCLYRRICSRNTI